ncbi:MAG: hypothetical protein AB1758_16710 [Candidatus Eremiobacterota bacterium]
MGRAFTFAETIICLGIITVGLLALISVTTYNVRAIGTQSQQRQLAATVAGGMMADLEQRLSENFDQSVAVTDGRLANYPEFTYQIEQVDEMGGDLKKIDLTLWWRNGVMKLSTKVLREP